MRKSRLLIAAAAVLYLAPANATSYKGKPAIQFTRKDNNSFMHFTIYDSEIQQIKASGKWSLVTPDFYAFDHQLPGLVPLYRLQKNGDHFFTIYSQERLNAMKIYGYSDEQICCYISASWIPGTAPLFRFQKSGIHHYQPLLSVVPIVATYDGWALEGIAGFVWPTRDGRGAPVAAPTLVGP